MEDTDVTTATAPTPDSAPAGAVLAALDGSPADGPILDWAADEAARLGAQLRLVTAVDPGIQLTPYDAIVTGAPSLSEQLEADAQRLLEAAAERVRARHPGLHVATSAPWGPAAASVVRMAEGARLVVVGAPARGLLERILLGSVALPVVAHAPCPAAVIPADTEVMPPRAIVVGVDGSERSGRAVALAAEMAAVMQDAPLSPICPEDRTIGRYVRDHYDGCRIFYPWSPERWDGLFTAWRWQCQGKAQAATYARRFDVVTTGNPCYSPFPGLARATVMSCLRRAAADLPPTLRRY